MNSFANLCLRGIFSLTLVAFIPAKADIITGYGVDTVVKNYVIDGASSSVTHNPGLDFFHDSVPQTYAISGKFEAIFSHYWWSYFLDGDIEGKQGSFLYEQNWLTFKNPELIGNIIPNIFVLPTYEIDVIGSMLSGDDRACGGPMPPNTSCSGYSMGAAASMRGAIGNGSLWLSGRLPIPGGALFEGFTYDIHANTVPEPDTLWLLLGGFFALLIANKKIARNRRL